MFFKDAHIPEDVLTIILAYLPAWPTYFLLNRVCKSMHQFLGSKMYNSVEQLNLLPQRGIPMKMVEKAIFAFDKIVQLLPHVKRLHIPMTMIRGSYSLNIISLHIWKDVDLHVFPYKCAKNPFSYLPHVKSITFYGVEFTTGVLRSISQHSNATFIFPFMFDAIYVGKGIAKLPNVSHFADFQDLEQFFECCRYFIGTSVLCVFLILVRNMQH